jgi:glycosyltransferase involved in cell wall biosynthesis
MKIAILGTRGIPNHYGGFEQYAELLSTYLVSKGHEVSVYNSHDHPYQAKEYKGVQIIHQFDPEQKMGTVGQFFYDLACILDSRKRKFDIVYQLGYTSSAIFNFLLPKRSCIVTNMDGMEWKRSKYNKYVQRFLMYSEKIAVKHSDFLVADSLGIKAYLDSKYHKNAFFSAYTAEIPQSFTASILDACHIQPKQYNLLVARMEPENNIETIIQAHTLNQYDFPLIVIGNIQNQFGQKMLEQYKGYPHIKFIGPVYDKHKLDSIRHFAHIYFHGHSVGGTNPSLLEAMACQCNIIAHDNIFNKSVLGKDAWYFNNALELNQLIRQFDLSINDFESFSVNNTEKIKAFYSESFVFEGLIHQLIDWQSQKVK